MLAINDYFVSLEDIKTCLKYNIPEKVFNEWYYEILESNENDNKDISLYSWCKEKGLIKKDFVIYLEDIEICSKHNIPKKVFKEWLKKSMESVKNKK